MKKSIKSLLSMVLILSMCIGIISTAGAANLTTKDISEMDFDSQSTDFYEGVSLLMGLGILKDTDTFPANLGEGISRAHFLEFVMRFALDGAGNTSGKTLPFTDVNSSASYYPSLVAAVEQGIIKEDTLFRPDDYITYEEALTVMFRVYDLDVLLDPSLPWPQDYVNLATKLKLYKGEMLLDHDGCLTYEGFFKLMGDVLEANVVEPHFTTGGIEYTISDDKYMEIWYDTYEFEGTVEANGITNISSEGTYKEDYLLIDGKYYYSGDKYQQYLGYDVEGFYQKDDFNTIISISKKYCKELVINSEDIEGVSLSGSTVNIKYDDNGKKKDAKISTDAAVIYNGKSFADDRFYVEWYDISRGSITLVTKNGSTYDIAFIDEYESYIVTGVDTDEEAPVIYLKDSEPVALEDTTSYTIKNADGKTITLADIQIDNVVSLKKAYDDTRLEIIVSDDEFSSPLTSVSKSDKLIYFGAKEYEVESEEFLNSLTLGVNYDVYVDAFGYIVDCVDAAEDEVNVGYIIAAQYNTWPKSVHVLMLKEGDDEPFEYLLADKVKIDGDTHKMVDIVADATADTPTGAFFGGSTEPMQVVIYKFNTEGKINYIDTATLGEKEDIKTTLYKKIDGERLYNKNDKFGAYDRSSAYSGIVKSRIAVNKNTMYINVPVTKDAEGNTIPTPYEDYETVSSVADETWYPNLTLYTHGNEGLVAIAGVFSDMGGGSSIGDKDLLSVVSRISFAEKDDEWMRRISVVRNGVETNIYVKPEDEYNATYTRKTNSETGEYTETVEEFEFRKLFDASSFIPQTLAVGDAVSYKVDTKGYVTVLKKYFDYKSQTLKDDDRFNTTVRIGGGYIDTYEGGYYGIVVDPDNYDPSNLEVLSKPSGGYIYEVSGRELIYEPMSNAKILKFSSAGTGATIYVSKLGWEVNRSYLYYKGQESSEDSYGALKASFYAKQGATASALTLTCDASGNITLPYNTTKQVVDGEEKDVSMFPNPGNCQFMGWSDGREVFAEGSTYTLTNFNVSFYPVWENSYKHSFVSDSQTATGKAPENIWSIAGESITLPENPFTNIGWEFIGWTDGTNTYQPGTQFLVTEQHVEFKAKWQEARTATFAAPSADYTGTAPVAISKLAGTVIQLPENPFVRAVSVGEYVFQGWKTGDTTYQAGDDFTMPDNNVEFTAVFKYVGATATVNPVAGLMITRTWDSTNSKYNYAVEDVTAETSYKAIHSPVKASGVTYPSGKNDARYMAYKIDLKGMGTITNADFTIKMSKINSGGMVYICPSELSWEDMQDATKIPDLATSTSIAKDSTTLKTLSRTYDITTYLAQKQAAGADYAVIYVYHWGTGSARSNYDGFRLYQLGSGSNAPSLSITTTSEQ